MSASFKRELRKAYKATQRDLDRLLSQQQKLEKEIVSIRKTLQELHSFCEFAGLQVEPASGAYLLEKSELRDEIRSILIANYPGWTRPNQVVAELERIGHDLTRFSNPQASIQMVLKRMVEAEEAQETVWPPDGKKIYRVPRSAADTDTPNVGMMLANIPERGRMVPLSSLLGNNFDVDKLPADIRAVLGGLSGLDKPGTGIKRKTLGQRIAENK
jgi:hypothetical protein